MAILYIVGAVLYALMQLDTQEPIRIAKGYYVSGLVCILLALFTPTEKAVYTMMGALAAKDAVSTPIGRKVLSLTEGKLDELIKESVKENRNE
jgi:hypothetical protein